MRPLFILPVVLTIAGLILAFLCVFAGNKPGFMNEYPIVTLNTSTLGHDLITNPLKNNPAISNSPLGGLLSSVSDITDDIDDHIDNIVDKLAHELGISQWYGWHLRNFCEGVYKPSASDPSAQLKVDECTNPSSTFNFKIADLLNKQLGIGPLHINLDKLKWPDSIQKDLDQVTSAYHAVLAFYGISIATAGISIIFGSSAISIFIASVIITIASSKIKNILNKKGNKIGVYAYRGHKYLTLTWCATVVMLLAILSFSAAMLSSKKSEGKKITEKPKQEVITE